MTQPPLTAADLDAMSPNDGEVAVSDLTPERRAAIRGWAGHQVVASEQLALLDALEAAEARATTAERGRAADLAYFRGKVDRLTAERNAAEQTQYSNPCPTCGAYACRVGSCLNVGARPLTDPPKAEPETGEQP